MEYELPKDPIILLGMINMKLRDFYNNMDALCDDLELDFESINATLIKAGFVYDAKTNQYHPL
ncbi:MAG TPA: DUF4250 domain-containing protein [Clostridiales bacterium UBA8960]|jgi:hypothetical protein|nr:DUF4250 domain-containing protein [Clostridiales bacterium UBA8960]